MPLQPFEGQAPGRLRLPSTNQGLALPLTLAVPLHESFILALLKVALFIAIMYLNKNYCMRQCVLLLFLLGLLVSNKIAAAAANGTSLLSLDPGDSLTTPVLPKTWSYQRH